MVTFWGTVIGATTWKWENSNMYHNIELWKKAMSKNAGDRSGENSELEICLEIPNKVWDGEKLEWGVMGT